MFKIVLYQCGKIECWMGEDCIRQFQSLSDTDNMKLCPIYKQIGQLVSLLVHNYVQHLETLERLKNVLRYPCFCMRSLLFMMTSAFECNYFEQLSDPGVDPDYISHLVWDHVRICQEVLEYVALESYLRSTAATVTQISTKNGWMNLQDARLAQHHPRAKHSFLKIT